MEGLDKGATCSNVSFNRIPLATIQDQILGGRAEDAVAILQARDDSRLGRGAAAEVGRRARSPERFPRLSHAMEA